MRTGQYLGVIIVRNNNHIEAEGRVRVPHDSDYFGLQDAALAIGEIIIDACARQKPSEPTVIYVVDYNDKEFQELIAPEQHRSELYQLETPTSLLIEFPSKDEEQGE